MKRIRVLLAAMPGMLLDMLTDILEPQPDMEVVAHRRGAEELVAAVAQTGPDIVIVATDRGVGCSAYDDLLYASPLLKILAIDGSRRGLLYELRPSRALLGEMSSVSLIDAIRAAAGSDARLRRMNARPDHAG